MQRTAARPHARHASAYPGIARPHAGGRRAARCGRGAERAAAGASAEAAAAAAAAAAPPRIDYLELLSRRRSDLDAPPLLLLAPMENLADPPMRVALASAAGGFDEACTEFIRVPSKATHVPAVIRGVTSGYTATELAPWGVPLGSQIMGSDPFLLAAAARRLAVDLGAPRVDLNCGCPANTVTGNGAGSTLLRTPERIQALVAALVAAVGGAAPVTVKMRSGFDDTSLFEDNLLAAQAGGAAFVTLHPRTKRQAYGGGADWELIARAKRVLDIPVVGNGDVVDAASALRLLDTTGCDGLMAGRGAISDPLLFHRIRAALAARARARAARRAADEGVSLPGASWRVSEAAAAATGSGAAAGTGAARDGWPFDEAAVVCAFLERYALSGPDGTYGTALNYSEGARLGRIKKVLKYVFSGQPELRSACGPLLRARDGAGGTPPGELLARAQELVRLHWRQGGPPDPVLVNHMSMKGVANGGVVAAVYGERQWQPRPSAAAGEDGGGGGAAAAAAAGGGGAAAAALVEAA